MARETATVKDEHTVARINVLALKNCLALSRFLFGCSMNARSSLKGEEAVQATPAATNVYQTLLCTVSAIVGSLPRQYRMTSARVTP